MEVISVKNEDMRNYKKTAVGAVYSAHVRISDVSTHANELITIISDTSWIEQLGVVKKTSFSARAERTIRKLVDDIFRKVDDTISTEFGEYMISVAAQRTLEGSFTHQRVPLAELLKEKVSGNPGFDFHTESASKLIAFGEAKYSGTTNPYRKALEQISVFITLRKDEADLLILDSFVSDQAVNNAAAGKKAFVAAFSINGDSPETIISNALSSDAIDALLKYPELYVIGIEVE